MAFHVTYQVVFLVKNHSCKIDFSSLHFFMMLPCDFGGYLALRRGRARVQGTRGRSRARAAWWQ